jgi:hypothetical protein
MRWYAAPLLVSLLGCPGKTPPVVVPTPPPPVVETCTVREADLVAVPDVAPVMGPTVVAAMRELGDPTGKPPQETLAALAKQLGHCTIAGVEAVFVVRPDAMWEEYHAVAFGTGGWIAQGHYLGSHRVGPAPAEGRPTSPLYLPPVRGEAGRWTRGGAPLDLTGAVPCWPTDGTGEVLKVEGRVIPYLWPLVSTEWIDHVKGKGANAIHLRPGPIGAADVCCGLESIGGPYLPDGSDWNPKWWALFHRIIRHAGAAGFVVEVDGLDGWAVKNTIGGSFHVPFPSQDVFTAMQLPINPSVRKWITKLVGETCLYGHVTYQVGNESSLTPGWSAEWERAMYGLFREAEKQPGCDGQVVHMVGSNTRDFDGPYDFFVSHWPDALTAPIAGRPTEVNEFNPSLSPGQFKSLHCTARKAGQSFWYWRSDGSDARQDETLDVLKAGCDAPASCPAPRPNRENLGFNVSCKPNGVCDATPLNTRDIAYFQAIGMPYLPDGHTPRASGPVRNECAEPPLPPNPPGFEGMCEDRLACEQYALSVPGVCEATAPLWRSDGEVVLEDQYGFRARCNGCTWLEACNCDGSRCERVALQ